IGSRPAARWRSPPSSRPGDRARARSAASSRSTAPAPSSARCRAAASKAPWSRKRSPRSRTASRGCSNSASATIRPGPSASPAAARCGCSSKSWRLEMRRRILDTLLAERAKGASLALVTDLKTGQQSLVYSDVAKGEFGLSDSQLAAVRTAIEADKSGIVDETLFVHVVNPAPRLFIVGAVHIAQALAPLASLIGYAVTVIDPRRAFATDERFPAVTLVSDWPDE